MLQVELPSDFKIILTGGGRVSNGVLEILKLLNIKKITKQDFLYKKFNFPTYVQLMTSDYNVSKDGESTRASLTVEPRSKMDEKRIPGAHPKGTKIIKINVKTYVCF